MTRFTGGCSIRSIDVGSSTSIIAEVASGHNDNLSLFSTFNMIILSFTSMMQLPVLVRYQASASSRSLIRAVVLFATFSTVGVIMIAYYTAGFAVMNFPPRIDEQWRVLPNPVFGSSKNGFSRIIPVVFQFIGFHLYGRFGRLITDTLVLALIATAIGSVMMHVHIIGITFSKDIYQTLFRRRCGLSESVFVGRLTMIISGLFLSLIYLYDKQSVAGFRFTVLFAEAAILAGLLAAQTAPAFVDRLYINRAGKFGITLGLIVGVLLVLVTSDLANEVFVKIAPGLSNSLIYHHLRRYSLFASIIANVCTTIGFSLIEFGVKRRFGAASMTN